MIFAPSAGHIGFTAINHSLDTPRKLRNADPADPIKRQPRKYSPKDWDDKESLIYRLYLYESKTFAQIVKILAEKHNFFVTAAMLTYRVGTKHRRKYMSRDEPSMRGRRPDQAVFRYPRVRTFDKEAQQRIRARRRDDCLVLDDRVDVLKTINAHLQPPTDAGYQIKQEFKQEFASPPAEEAWVNSRGGFADSHAAAGFFA